MSIGGAWVLATPHAEYIAFAIIITACAVFPLLWIIFGSRRIRIGVTRLIQILSVTALCPVYGLFLMILPALTLSRLRPRFKVGRVIFAVATIFLIGLPFYLGAAFVLSHKDGMVHGRDAVEGVLFVWTIKIFLGQCAYILWMPVYFGRLNDVGDSTTLVSGVNPMLLLGGMIIFKPDAIIVGIGWAVLLAMLLVGSRSSRTRLPVASNPDLEQMTG